jgi:hypothetical protein
MSRVEMGIMGHSSYQKTPLFEVLTNTPPPYLFPPKTTTFSPFKPKKPQFLKFGY